jgi:regulation of enolase protein 1 (concanavalin A-like superfamily)
VEGDFQLSARVRCTFAAAFDAGALLLGAADRRSVKLAFEVSLHGEPMLVSVVTDGSSDDANAFVVEDAAVWLRISRRGSACALHARLDGKRWRFVRHLPLAAPAGVRAGFLAQSPTGDGASARFDEIDFVAEGVADLRSGV